MFSINSISRNGLIAVRCLPSFGGFGQVCRTLYSEAALGVDNYKNAREKVKNQFTNVQEKFKSKMEEFVSSDSKSMIFTEDLKHMVHLAEETDLNLVQDMMFKFNNQNKDLRFGSFVFGPVVMRMYHYLNKPKEAFKVFTTKEMDGFFDQLITFQILMDLLLQNEMYNEVIEVFEIVQKKQVQGARYPKNTVVLVLAACYKLNSEQSFNYVKTLWSELTKVGHYPMRRAGTFAAALALKQNSPDVALEMLSSLKNHTYITIRNLKVEALVELNRPDDALQILRPPIQFDRNTERKHTFTEETIAKLKNSIEKIGNAELATEFEKLQKQLRAFQNITSDSLDSFLCSEINAYSQPKVDTRVGFDTRRSYQRRPGLEEMY